MKEKIFIEGGKKLSGSIPISGAKNSCLTLMPASLLSESGLTLNNVPNLSDVDTMKALLESLGCVVQYKKGDKTLDLKTSNESLFLADYDIVKKMRASILVLGPLLARLGQATVALPGGCAIGARPINLHLMALEALGARFSMANGYVKGKVGGSLKGCKIEFPSKSVGATANTIMAAVLAKGTTELLNVAREPEIIDLCKCLKAMGCKIEGEGESRIIIEGVDSLKETTHRVVMDRIELGTFIIAGAITNSDIKLTGGNTALLETFISKLNEVGVEIHQSEEYLQVKRTNSSAIKCTNILTEPFPGFPTDLQAQMMALLSIADGVSKIEEQIFENRFMHVPELVRMGANIEVSGRKAFISGADRLKGAPVKATDLRASVSLVLAGLIAEGLTEIDKIHHIDRGYEDIIEKLTSCGAVIGRH
ncbi:UDP-N-acetylglucosamine 1-carboxyvinyltransferase [Paracoccaceae bacterium]|nr:UDP-N-acetylglucosamine 1-carboxyvinyltransferase [Paracoccaceae bacterium]